MWPYTSHDPRPAVTSRYRTRASLPTSVNNISHILPDCFLTLLRGESSGRGNMLKGGFKGERLRVNLRLAINRLKLLEKKKTEMAMKSRKEIADYLSCRKDERARIRVEHIIREDYMVEAMEILELYCDLLLARFGLIQSMKELDPGLAEAVSTVIWAAPRLIEISELKIVANQLCHKYSKEYGNLCRTNQIGTVSERLMHKLSPEAPPKILVERYLIEIAKNYNVQYEPDARVMAEAPTGFEVDGHPIDFTNDKKGGPGGRGGGGDFRSNGPRGPYPQITQTTPDVGIYEECTFIQPPPKGKPPVPGFHPSYDSLKPPGLDPQVFPAPDNGADIKPGATAPGNFDHLTLPKLPSVPVSPARQSPTNDSSAYEDIDFEDLSKRLESLKKKT
ncbi:IST1 homolog isoform X1 [Ranitomeya variabilis]|uniref:IST1 homolog isoform X1 n=2 Tax=Ranitomeya variabilis TaxID=490064 RepID=UPI004055E705